MKRLKVCTIFSPSHLLFYKKFMNSYPYQEGVELVVNYLPQECTGEYECKDFYKPMARKVDFIIKQLKTLQTDEYLMYTDCDVVFYKPFRDDIIKCLECSSCDMLFQHDGISLCAGLFIARRSDSVIQFFEAVKEATKQYNNDQTALNMLIRSFPVQFGVLPDRYYTFGTRNARIEGGVQRWEPDITDFFVPNDIILHHANWTSGEENKLKLISKVKEMIETNKTRDLSFVQATS